MSRSSWRRTKQPSLHSYFHKKHRYIDYRTVGSAAGNRSNDRGTASDWLANKVLAEAVGKYSPSARTIIEDYGKTLRQQDFKASQALVQKEIATRHSELVSAQADAYSPWKMGLNAAAMGYLGHAGNAVWTGTRNAAGFSIKSNAVLGAAAIGLAAGHRYMSSKADGESQTRYDKVFDKAADIGCSVLGQAACPTV